MKPFYFVPRTLTDIAVLAVLVCSLSAKCGAAIFPTGLPEASWQTFQAAGYSKPVTGIIYRGKPRPICGVPMGGVGTGCIDVEASGMFGYSSIFNHLTPRGGP